MYALHRLTDRKVIPPIPIYVDSPLSVRITEIFKLHPECFDEETRAFLRQNGDPFGFENLRYISDVEDSKALNGQEGPMMIIAASGMCEAGRILHHLRNAVEDAKNMVLIIGFQAQHTLGRRIAERQVRGEDLRRGACAGGGGGGDGRLQRSRRPGRPSGLCGRGAADKLRRTLPGPRRRGAVARPSGSG